MESGKPSKTAWRVAVRRAAHQLLDHPRVLEDPLAVPILGGQLEIDHGKEQLPISRSFRAFMAARSRYVEDNLAAAVAAGVEQYVVLGAGLDTFAYRNPFAGLRVFEVDFPATQEWKRGLLHAASIAEPQSLTFVPLDFEHSTLRAGLAAAGLVESRPAFFGWLGVVPYLPLSAFRATVDFIAGLPAGSGVSFDYAVAVDDLSPRLRYVHRIVAERVAAAGEPFKLYFGEEQLNNELRAAGFMRIEQLDSIGINERYFCERADGLALPEEGLGKLATGWV